MFNKQLLRIFVGLFGVGKGKGKIQPVTCHKGPDLA
jgi:hypothetical protein